MPASRPTRTRNVSAERRSARLQHVRAVSTLLDDRRDLHGVAPLADLLDEAVRWSA